MKLLIHSQIMQLVIYAGIKVNACKYKVPEGFPDKIVYKY